MKKNNLRILALSTLTSGLIFFSQVAGGKEATTGPALVDASHQAIPYPGCVKIFNGQNFDGWEADASTWSIVDGAMRGVGGSSRLAYTKADYGSFRLIFTARMNPVNRDHLGVLFWGDR